MMKTKITKMNRIFVFGSNLGGRHALFAIQNKGAIYGQGFGLQGESYALPTKGYKMEILPLEVIKRNLEDFALFSRQNQQYTFDLTPVGCGLAGYTKEEVWPIVLEALRGTNNVELTDSWFEDGWSIPID